MLKKFTEAMIIFLDIAWRVIVVLWAVYLAALLIFAPMYFFTRWLFGSNCL